MILLLAAFVVGLIYLVTSDGHPNGLVILAAVLVVAGVVWEVFFPDRKTCDHTQSWIQHDGWHYYCGDCGYELTLEQLRELKTKEVQR